MFGGRGIALARFVVLEGLSSLQHTEPCRLDDLGRIGSHHGVELYAVSLVVHGVSGFTRTGIRGHRAGETAGDIWRQVGDTVNKFPPGRLHRLREQFLFLGIAAGTSDVISQRPLATQHPPPCEVEFVGGGNEASLLSINDRHLGNHDRLCLVCSLVLTGEIWAALWAESPSPGDRTPRFRQPPKGRRRRAGFPLRLRALSATLARCAANRVPRFWASPTILNAHCPEETIRTANQFRSVGRFDLRGMRRHRLLHPVGRSKELSKLRLLR